MVGAYIIAQFQFGPDQASSLAGQVDALFLTLLAITGTILALVAVTILYCLARYRRNAQVDRTPIPDSSLPLETAWTVIPMFIFLGMFGWGATLYFKKNQSPSNATEIYVIGKQWMWKVQHLQGKREINELHVPVGRTIRLIMTSQDVIHDFFLPAFRVKQDVLPGTYTTQWFAGTKTGSFPIFCAQYCGTYHANMIGQVIVQTPQDYEEWLSSGTTEPAMALSGANLFRSLGCSGCHAVNASVRAPLLNNLYGSPVPLQNGQVVTADERYIRDSILQPELQIAAGYDPIMPSFKDRVSEEELTQLISYIKSLSKSTDR
ncbi:MAG: cytochrome c oxidase subunit II [Verrucomicrobia bacterium]|nr:cytochrome c oxidase subunit II [Verrucomicrobiota bacterium]